MKRMSTIKGALAEIKQEDPFTCITEHFLRQLIWQGKLLPCKAGNKNLIDMDALMNLLENHTASEPSLPPVEPEKPAQILTPKPMYLQMPNQPARRVRPVLDYSR